MNYRLEQLQRSECTMAAEWLLTRSMWTALFRTVCRDKVCYCKDLKEGIRKQSGQS